MYRDVINKWIMIAPYEFLPPFLQTMLGDAINRLIKFSLKSLKEKISYAHLMCGEYGLVHALINIFSFG